MLQNLELRHESGKVLKLCSGIAIYHALSKRKTCLACILKAVEDLFLLRNERVKVLFLYKEFEHIVCAELDFYIHLWSNLH